MEDRTLLSGVAAVADSFDIANDDTETPQTLDVLQNDDLGTTATTFDIISFDTALYGTIELVDGDPGYGTLDTLRYTPYAGMTGTESISYTIEGDDLTQSAGQITINLTAEPGNQAPDAVDDSFQVNMDVTTELDVLANDTDPESDPLTLYSIDSQPNSGSAQIVNGKIEYTPNPGFIGTDNLTYTIQDTGGLQDSATVSLTIVSGNQAPDAVDDSLQVVADETTSLDVLANDTDPENDQLTLLSIDSQPSFGTAQIVNGQIEYTPGTGYTGTDTLTYSISDTGGLQDTASVSLTVAFPPVEAVNDQSSVLSGQSIDIDVLANDVNPEGQPLSLLTVSGPVGGTAEIVELTPGEHIIRYTANSNFAGIENLTYTMQDGDGNTHSAILTVVVDESEDFDPGDPNLDFQFVDLQIDGQVYVPGSVISTYNPVVTGRIQSATYNIDNVAIEYEFQDDIVFSVVTSDDGLGSFEIDLSDDLILTGSVILKIRVAYMDDITGEIEYTTWNDLSFEYDLSGRSPYQVVNLMLVNDTDVPGDGVTSDLKISGGIQGVPLLDIQDYVEYDLNNDGTRDGIFEIDDLLTGDFTADLNQLALNSGTYTIGFRAVSWNEELSEFDFSPWSSITVEYISPNSTDRTITNLALINDNGASSADGVTSDPRIEGFVVDAGIGVNLATVEYDLNGDGNADGQSMSLNDGTGRFVIDLRGNQIAEGPIQVQVRTVEWIDLTNTEVKGDWNAFNFEYQSNVAIRPQFGTVVIEESTDSSGSPLVVLSGDVQSEGLPAEGVTVQIDIDNDGDIDAIAVSDTNGEFVYEVDARVYDSTTVTMAVRITEQTSESSEVWFSNWQTASLVLTAPAAVAAPSIDAFDLANSIEGIGVEGDLWFEGQVTYPSDLQGTVFVEYDSDLDGNVDGEAVVAIDGSFVVVLAAASMVDGNYQISLRTRIDFLDGTETTYSNFQTFGYEYQRAEAVVSEPPEDPPAPGEDPPPPPNQLPSITQLFLSNDTGTQGDGITSDPRIAGTVSHSDGDVNLLPVEYDINSDYVADGVVYTSIDSTGSFEIDLTNSILVDGGVTVNVRVGELNDEDLSIDYGAWTSLSFTFESESAAAPVDPVVPDSANSYDELQDQNTEAQLANPDLNRTILTPADGELAEINPEEYFPTLQTIYSNIPTADLTDGYSVNDTVTDTYTDADGATITVTTTTIADYSVMHTVEVSGDWIIDEDLTSSYVISTTYTLGDVTYQLDQTGSYSYDLYVTGVGAVISYTYAVSQDDHYVYTRTEPGDTGLSNSLNLDSDLITNSEKHQWMTLSSSGSKTDNGDGTYSHTLLTDYDAYGDSKYSVQYVSLVDLITGNETTNEGALSSGDTAWNHAADRWVDTDVFYTTLEYSYIQNDVVDANDSKTVVAGGYNGNDLIVNATEKSSSLQTIDISASTSEYGDGSFDSSFYRLDVEILDSTLAETRNEPFVDTVDALDAEGTVTYETNTRDEKTKQVLKEVDITSAWETTTFDTAYSSTKTKTHGTADTGDATLDREEESTSTTHTIDGKYTNSAGVTTEFDSDSLLSSSESKITVEVTVSESDSESVGGDSTSNSITGTITTTKEEEHRDFDNLTTGDLTPFIAAGVVGVSSTPNTKVDYLGTELVLDIENIEVFTNARGTSTLIDETTESDLTSITSADYTTSDGNFTTTQSVSKTLHEVSTTDYSLKYNKLEFLENGEYVVGDKNGEITSYLLSGVGLEVNKSTESADYISNLDWVATLSRSTLGSDATTTLDMSASSTDSGSGTVTAKATEYIEFETDGTQTKWSELSHSDNRSGTVVFNSSADNSYSTSVTDGGRTTTSSGSILSNTNGSSDYSVGSSGSGGTDKSGDTTYSASSWYSMTGNSTFYSITGSKQTLSVSEGGLTQYAQITTSGTTNGVTNSGSSVNTTVDLFADGTTSTFSDASYSVTTTGTFTSGSNSFGNFTALNSSVGSSSRASGDYTSNSNTTGMFNSSASGSEEVVDGVVTVSSESTSDTTNGTTAFSNTSSSDSWSATSGATNTQASSSATSSILGSTGFSTSESWSEVLQTDGTYLVSTSSGYDATTTGTTSSNTAQSGSQFSNGTNSTRTMSSDSTSDSNGNFTTDIHSSTSTVGNVTTSLDTYSTTETGTTVYTTNSYTAGASQSSSTSNPDPETSSYSSSASFYYTSSTRDGTDNYLSTSDSSEELFADGTTDSSSSYSYTSSGDGTYSSNSNSYSEASSGSFTASPNPTGATVTTEDSWSTSQSKSTENGTFTSTNTASGSTINGVSTSSTSSSFTDDGNTTSNSSTDAGKIQFSETLHFVEATDPEDPDETGSSEAFQLTTSSSFYDTTGKNHSFTSNASSTAADGSTTSSSSYSSNGSGTYNSGSQTKLFSNSSSDFSSADMSSSMSEVQIAQSNSSGNGTYTSTASGSTFNGGGISTSSDTSTYDSLDNSTSSSQADSTQQATHQHQDGNSNAFQTSSYKSTSSGTGTSHDWRTVQRLADGTTTEDSSSSSSSSGSSAFTSSGSSYRFSQQHITDESGGGGGWVAIPVEPGFSAPAVNSFLGIGISNSIIDMLDEPEDENSGPSDYEVDVTEENTSGSSSNGSGTYSNSNSSAESRVNGVSIGSISSSDSQRVFNGSTSSQTTSFYYIEGTRNAADITSSSFARKDSSGTTDSSDYFESDTVDGSTTSLSITSDTETTDDTSSSFSFSSRDLFTATGEEHATSITSRDDAGDSTSTLTITTNTTDGVSTTTDDFSASGNTTKASWYKFSTGTTEDDSIDAKGFTHKEGSVFNTAGGSGSGNYSVTVTTVDGVDTYIKSSSHSESSGHFTQRVSGSNTFNYDYFDAAYGQYVINDGGGSFSQFRTGKTDETDDDSKLLEYGTLTITESSTSKLTDGQVNNSKSGSSNATITSPLLNLNATINESASESSGASLTSNRSSSTTTVSDADGSNATTTYSGNSTATVTDGHHSSSSTKYKNVTHTDPESPHFVITEIVYEHSFSNSEFSGTVSTKTLADGTLEYSGSGTDHTTTLTETETQDNEDDNGLGAQVTDTTEEPGLTTTTKTILSLTSGEFSVTKTDYTTDFTVNLDGTKDETKTGYTSVTEGDAWQKTRSVFTRTNDVRDPDGLVIKKAIDIDRTGGRNGSTTKTHTDGTVTESDYLQNSSENIDSTTVKVNGELYTRTTNRSESKATVDSNDTFHNADSKTNSSSYYFVNLTVEDVPALYAQNVVTPFVDGFYMTGGGGSELSAGVYWYKTTSDSHTTENVTNGTGTTTLDTKYTTEEFYHLEGTSSGAGSYTDDLIPDDYGYGGSASGSGYGSPTIEQGLIETTWNSASMTKIKIETEDAYGSAYDIYTEPPSSGSGTGSLKKILTGQTYSTSTKAEAEGYSGYESKDEEAESKKLHEHYKDFQAQKLTLNDEYSTSFSAGTQSNESSTSIQDVGINLFYYKFYDWAQYDYDETGTDDFSIPEDGWESRPEVYDNSPADTSSSGSSSWTPQPEDFVYTITVSQTGPLLSFEDLVLIAEAYANYAGDELAEAYDTLAGWGNTVLDWGGYIGSGEAFGDAWEGIKNLRQMAIDGLADLMLEAYGEEYLADPDVTTTEVFLATTVIGAAGIYVGSLVAGALGVTGFTAAVVTAGVEGTVTYAGMNLLGKGEIDVGGALKNGLTDAAFGGALHGGGKLLGKVGKPVFSKLASVADNLGGKIRKGACKIGIMDGCFVAATGVVVIDEDGSEAVFYLGVIGLAASSALLLSNSKSPDRKKRRRKRRGLPDTDDVDDLRRDDDHDIPWEDRSRLAGHRDDRLEPIEPATTLVATRRQSLRISLSLPGESENSLTFDAETGELVATSSGYEILEARAKETLPMTDKQHSVPAFPLRADERTPSRASEAAGPRKFTIFIPSESSGFSVPVSPATDCDRRRMSAQGTTREQPGGQTKTDRPPKANRFGGFRTLILLVFALCSLGLIGYSFTKPDTKVMRIADVEVGQSLPWSENPVDGEDLSLGSKIDPPNWRKLTLKAPKKDGSYSDVELLRPLWWVALTKAEIGRTVFISVPECGIDGNAEVLNIEPCPPVSDQDHVRFVTGKFVHHVSMTYDLAVEGQDEPIGVTGNHRFWSEDRQDFVRADSLRAGERLRASNGTPRVVNLTPRTGPRPVFNLEVAGSHLYQVSNAGILVHNGTGAFPCPPRGLPADVVEMIQNKISDTGDAQLYLIEPRQRFGIEGNYVQNAADIADRYGNSRSYFDLGPRYYELTDSQRTLANRYFLDIIASRGQKVHINVPKAYYDKGNTLKWEIDDILTNEDLYKYIWENQWSLVPP